MKPFEAHLYTAQQNHRWTQQQGSLRGLKVMMCTAGVKNIFMVSDRLLEQSEFFPLSMSQDERESEAYSDDWVSSLWWSCYITI